MTVSRKIAGLSNWHLGILEFLVFSLNILNKSDKHFLHFHDSFHGLETYIHIDFHLEKYILIITFTPDKIKYFYEEKLKEQNKLLFFLDLLKTFFFLTF